MRAFFMKTGVASIIASATAISLYYLNGDFQHSAGDSITPQYGGVADLLTELPSGTQAKRITVSHTGIIADSQSWLFAKLLDEILLRCPDFSYKASNESNKRVDVTFLSNIGRLNVTEHTLQDSSGVKAITSALGSKIEFFEHNGEKFSYNGEVLSELADNLASILCEWKPSANTGLFSAHGLRIAEGARESIHPVMSPNENELLI